MNLANLFEVDWSVCTDARAKANNFWWHALKNFEFVPKTNPTGSSLIWRGGKKNYPDTLRRLEELAAYRFEAIRRVLHLQRSAKNWPTLDSTDRSLLIDRLGKGYNPGCLFFRHDPGRPDSAVQLASGGVADLFWDLAQPDDVLIHNFRILVEAERQNHGISLGGRRGETTKGMIMSPPQWHLLELLDERLYEADTRRKVGRPSLSGPPNAYSAEEQRKVKNLVGDALKWAESCHCSLW